LSTASNAATLISGASGSGKSTQLARAAEWVWATYKKRSRLYALDGGGYPTDVESLIAAGIIEVWRVRSRAGTEAGEGLIEETLARMSQGYWPSTIDPKTGLCPEADKLVPPVEVVWTIKCPAGHTVRTAATPDLSPILCQACKITVDGKNAKPERIARTLLPADVGAVMFDGWTAASSWFLSSLSGRRGRGQMEVGETRALGRIVTATYAFSPTTRTHM
jgi:hypothetical protein